MADAGFAVAIPALTRSVTSTVPGPDIGKASGTYTTMRQLGGVFGVSILGAVFASTGSFASAWGFSDGFGLAMGVAAVLAIPGAMAGLGIRDHHAAVDAVLRVSSSRAAARD